MLYEVAIIEKPTPQGKKSGKTEKIVLAPTAVVANDENAASIKASKMADFSEVNEDMLEVLVRPFVVD